MSTFKQFTASMVDNHINDQWVNYRKALIPPQAREELLGYSIARFYVPCTTNPINIFQDEEKTVAHYSPVQADSSGAFPKLYFDNVVKVEITDDRGRMIATLDSMSFADD